VLMIYLQLPLAVAARTCHRLGVLALIPAPERAVRVSTAPTSGRQPVASELVVCKVLQGCGQGLLAVAAPAQGGERVALEEHFFYGREEVAHMLTNTPLSVIDIAVWWMRST